MKICVCVKIVPRAVVPLRLDPATLRLDRSGATEIDPNDMHAIEEALRLRDRVGGEVLTLSVAPEEGRESLRLALAMGVDRVLVASDPAIAGSDLLGTSRVLAVALEREHPDIVVFGSQSADGAGGLLWSAVAERLRLPLLSGVRSIDVIDDEVRAGRQILGGQQVLAAPMPAVVALSGSAFTPRYPSFRDIVSAKKKAIESARLSDLGIDPAAVGASAARTAVLMVAPAPPRRAAGEVVEDEGQGAAWLYRFLVERGLS